jgi:Leucine-rich repeat (LRR) protein
MYCLQSVFNYNSWRIQITGGDRTANYRTFIDWCTNKANLNPEARRTVDLLLEQAETNECEPANQKLSSLDNLYLNSNNISDITPLKSLTKLTYLSLGGNPIANQTCPIKPESICNF